MEEIQPRLTELEELSRFADETEREAIMIVQSLGWSVDNIKNLQVQQELKCPFDKSHCISIMDFETHYMKCKQKSEGKMVENLETNNLNYSKDTIISDENKMGQNKNNYDIHINNIKKGSQLPLQGSSMSQESDFRNISFNLSDNSKTFLEELAENRDLKRRRTKYKVSTKSKTYTEVIREVIDNQMSEYAEFLNIKKSDFDSEDKYDKVQKHKNISRDFDHKRKEKDITHHSNNRDKSAYKDNLDKYPHKRKERDSQTYDKYNYDDSSHYKKSSKKKHDT